MSQVETVQSFKKVGSMTTLWQDSFLFQNTHRITDGTLSCSYQELPSLFVELDEQFVRLGIDPHQTVAYECPNSVTGAVILLYLLARSRSFVLLPPAQHASKGAGYQPSIPAFCHHHLTLQPDRAFSAALQGRPLSATGELPAGRLYLRTSGSLGTSKIVVHQQEKLLRNAQNCLQKYQITANDRMLIPVPIFHMYGMGAAFLSAALAGAAIQIVDKANILKILTYEKEFQPTLAFLTPDLCEMMLRWKRKNSVYRVIVTSGQRIQESLFEQFDARFGSCLVNQYGSTEMGAIAACDWQEPLTARIGTIGTPMEGVELRLEGMDSLTQIGELSCRHPYGYLGYVDERGQWLSQADTWYRTGDLACAVGPDRLKVVGRNQDSFNRRGFLVNLIEVAQEIERLEGVQSTVVLYLERTDRLVACCVATAEASQIREACFGQLPPYALPDEVVVVESFPLLPSGKIDRQTLQTKLETAVV